MKVIDLLNKIANNEEVPKKVMYKNEIWEYYKDLEDYIRAGKPNTLFTMYYIHKILNDEIKIIEEKPISLKPFKDYLEDTNDLPQIDKDNRIIEYIHQLSLKVNYLLEKESDK